MEGPKDAIGYFKSDGADVYVTKKKGESNEDAMERVMADHSNPSEVKRFFAGDKRPADPGGEGESPKISKDKGSNPGNPTDKKKENPENPFETSTPGDDETSKNPIARPSNVPNVQRDPDTSGQPEGTKEKATTEEVIEKQAGEDLDNKKKKKGDTDAERYSQLKELQRITLGNFAGTAGKTGFPGPGVSS
jgi:hypothetical protein